MSSEIAVKVENISKCYEIYSQPRDRLKQFIFPKLSRWVGLPPNKYCRDFWALKDVSFEVKRGETVGIIGRNGSGKSTLLQMICGTLSPTSGNISTNGRVAALLELGAGFNPELSGRENVYMNAVILGMNKEEVDKRFNAIAAFADIGQFMEQPVKTYSSGMVVRLGFAVIANVDADILIIDEALAVGDAFFTQKCMRFLHGFMEVGTLLFVSHDTGAVLNLCSKAILLSCGRIVEIGAPKDVAAHYLESLYEPHQNISGARAENSNVQTDKINIIKDFRDMREDFINASNLRNDIEIFKFNDDNSGFGTGDAKIVSVQVLDTKYVPLSWVVGGEDVIFEVRCLANKDMYNPIVGFQFKDRLGQVVFGDNTYIAYQYSPQVVLQDRELTTRFDFRLPVLPAGDYSVSVAIANGSQEKHVQHHWIHDALIVRVHASSICFGLIGVPMRKITLVVN